MRSKRGEGEVSRKGGGTYRLGSETGNAVGGQWRRLVVAVRCRRWRRLVVVIRFRSALTSFLAGHRAPLSLVRSCPGRRTIVGVDAGGVALMACVRPVVARGGRAWFSWALVVVCALSCRLCAVVSFARGRVVCAWSCRLRDVVSFARSRCLY